MTRVLIVDDDPDILESLEMVLSESFDVVTALDGREALRILSEGPVDVAVVDLMMPVLDGESLVREMRARGIATPVILISATPELRRLASRIDAAATLQKPFDVADLERCIAAVAR